MKPLFKIGVYEYLKQEKSAIIIFHHGSYTAISFGINKNGAHYVGVFENYAVRPKQKLIVFMECYEYRILSKEDLNRLYARLVYRFGYDKGKYDCVSNTRIYKNYPLIRVETIVSNLNYEITRL